MTSSGRIATLEEEVRRLRELLCPTVHYMDVIGPRQTKVLSALHVARGRLVSFDRLVTAAWPDSEPEAVTVRMLVWMLRRKLTPRGVEIVTGAPLSYGVTPASLPVLDSMRM